MEEALMISLMHNQQLLLLVLSAIITILVAFLYRSKRSRLPPGPPGLPLIGHLHILLNKTPAHVSLFNLSRAYGPLIWLKLGTQSVIIAATPAAARHVLQTHDHAFSYRPRLAVPSQLHCCQDILFASPSDPTWKFLRQLCLTQLFSKKRFEAFHHVRSEEVRALGRSILGSMGKPIQLRAQAHAMAGNIICRMAFSKRLAELATIAQAHCLHSIVDLTGEMNELLGVFNLGDYFPILAWLDLQGYGRKTKALLSKFEPVLQKIIEERCHEHESRASDSRAEDFLDLLLRSASLLNGSQKQSSISLKNVKGVLMNMFGGGIDTSALTIEWALGELLANPIKMKKLQEELGNVVGTARLVEESDIASLPYLQAVVKEAMRLHPVVPLLVPHLTNQACEVMGYTVPANTMAYINVWAIGRDPDTWESPLEFLPERFLGGDIDVNGQHFELLPFGAGRRGCPGWMLGLVTVQAALATLIQSFEWAVVDELAFSEANGLVLCASNPLTVMAKPKLSTQLIES